MPQYKRSDSANKIVIKWSEVEGADGYHVCSYDEATKKYTLMGSTTQLGYSIMNADANTVYTIRVVAYTMIDGKMVLGTSSSTLKATTKR